MINPRSINFLASIKNAYLAKNQSLTAPFSKFCQNIAEILKKHNFIEDYSVTGDIKKEITLKLFYPNNFPAITNINIISKPGRRVYKNSYSLPWGKSKTSLIIVSTSAGLFSQKQASAKNLGGEILAEIY